MVINGAIHPNRAILNNTKSFIAVHHPMSVVNNRNRVHLVNSLRQATTGMIAAVVLLGSPVPSEETLSNVPQTLSAPAECPIASLPKDCDKQSRIQKPKSRKAESCTIKCVTTCIRGGGGSPGEGPLNVRRPLVVFKEGFRSRRYCLVECSDICNLIKDGDDGP